MSHATRRHLVGCGWFWAWALVGAGAAFSALSTLGVLTALPVGIVAVLMARSATASRSAFGLISGAGLLLLYIAWIHRFGDGVDPRPWFVLGTLLLAAGVALHSLRERRSDWK